MCPLFDQNRPDHSNSSSEQSFDFGEASWDDVGIGSDLNSICNKVPLPVVFKKYNIVLESKYSNTGWDYQCQCPFEDHDDDNPSFGYNEKEDVFNCFGCGRAGRSVHFISYIENVSLDKAIQILSSKFEQDLNFSIKKNSIDYDELDKLLIEYSEFVRSFIIENRNDESAMKYISDVNYIFDLYLKYSLDQNSLKISEFSTIILELKDKINSYQ
jgi:hypothetical protein